MSIYIHNVSVIQSTPNVHIYSQRFCHPVNPNCPYIFTTFLSSSQPQMSIYIHKVSVIQPTPNVQIYSQSFCHPANPKCPYIFTKFLSSSQPQMSIYIHKVSVIQSTPNVHIYSQSFCHTATPNVIYSQSSCHPVNPKCPYIFTKFLSYSQPQMSTYIHKVSLIQPNPNLHIVIATKSLKIGEPSKCL